MRINHNIAALNTYRQLNSASGAQSKSMEKLSSGLRINGAADDAAGLAISEKMRGQIRGLDMASKNAQDGISMIQTAEGALNETHSILQRMREVATQAANDTNEPNDRQALQDEMNQLAEEIDRIATTTQFNGKELIDGSLSNQNIQIGANASQKLSISISDMSATGSELNIATASGAAELTEASVVKVADPSASPLDLTDLSNNIDVSGYTGKDNLEIKVKALTVGDASGTNGTFEVTINGKTSTVQANSDAADSGLTINTGNGNITIAADADWSADDEFNFNVKGANQTIAGPDVMSHANAESAITNLDTAIERVSAERSKLGAWQNRLDHTINNLNTSSENLTAAESRIRDVDMAKEMMNQTKNSILSQAAQAMLAQSNQMPQGVLQLLR
ncbi:flagellin [Bacillus infantis]|uniref:flagellin N-terminal helical domain-containing protein n=1 Tax=Bacillus infantis TaxID=324767 RepID=UPI00209FC592|nr:flagellin [Bacillus infantis]MCP1160497.1 flagellin [Bacillus infantis]